jgi:hypothetical protein
VAVAPLRYRRGVIFVVAALVGLVFGAGDQYLGSLRSMVALGPWTVSVSQMSALWLVLPFAFGCTQDRRRRAMVVGLVVTVSALLGYFAMTLSPIEGVALSNVPAGIVRLLRSNLVVIVGGLVTAPAFGLLGQRWRVSRSWASAAFAAGALLLEPLARQIDGRLLGPSWVWAAEVALGACLVAGFVLAGTARRRSARPV